MKETIKRKAARINFDFGKLEDLFLIEGKE